MFQFATNIGKNTFRILLSMIVIVRTVVE